MDNSYLTSFAPGQSTKKLRQNMSAKTKDVQRTDLKSTLHNENVYKLIPKKWKETFSEDMWTEIEQNEEEMGEKLRSKIRCP